MCGIPQEAGAEITWNLACYIQSLLMKSGWCVCLNPTTFGRAVPHASVSGNWEKQKEREGADKGNKLNKNFRRFWKSTDSTRYSARTRTHTKQNIMVNLFLKQFSAWTILGHTNKQSNMDVCLVLSDCYGALMSSGFIRTLSGLPLKSGEMEFRSLALWWRLLLWCF